MFGMLRMAMTLLICILAVGFYLGWFSFSRSPPDPQSNKVNINVSVDKKKIRSDLQKAEQNVAKRIQDINNQPQGNAADPPSGQQPAAPGLNFGPISVQPSGQPARSPNGQPAAPGLSFGPISVQPSSQPAGPPSGQPAEPAADSRADAGLSVHRALGCAAPGRRTVEIAFATSSRRLLPPAGGRRWTENTCGGGPRRWLGPRPAGSSSRPHSPGNSGSRRLRGETSRTARRRRARRPRESCPVPAAWGNSADAGARPRPAKSRPSRAAQ